MRIRSLLPAAIIVALLACGKDETPPDPTLVLDRESLGFGQEFDTSVYVGTSREENLQLQNRGAQPLIVERVDVRLPPELTMQTTGQFTIEPGGHAFLRFFFTPKEAKLYSGSITIVSNAANAPEKIVEISGRGALPPAADGGTGDGGM